MMDYLVFQLYGPLASWGEPATGEIRRSATYPTRSAVVGLLAAALGLRRDDEQSLARLRDNVLIAVKQLSAGVILSDYHTTQVPRQDRKAWRQTRRDELDMPKSRLNTILSTREYRCDGYWKVAIRTTDNCPWTLDNLATALRRPSFPLYLGRRSCPLAAPLSPTLVDTNGIQSALATTFDVLTTLNAADERRRLGINGQVTHAWEGDGGDITPQETRYPYDQPLHRGRWQFARRSENWHQTNEEP